MWMYNVKCQKSVYQSCGYHGNKSAYNKLKNIWLDAPQHFRKRIYFRRFAAIRWRVINKNVWGESRKCSPPVQIGLKITLTDLVADHTRIAAFNEDLNTKHCATARKQESSEEPQSSRTERSGWVLLPGNCLPGIKLQVYGCRLQWFWPPGCGCAVYYPYGGGTALPQSEGTLFVFVSVLVYFAILKTELRLPVYLRFRPHLSLPGQ